MSNPNPKTEQLALGRGKRPKLNNKTVGMRMSAQTRQCLEEIAESYGCMYGGSPWIAGLLEQIGSGKLLVVPAPPPRPGQDADSTAPTDSSLKEKMQHKMKKKLAPPSGPSANPGADSAYDNNSSDRSLSRDSH